ncbi:Sec-independent protein translocase subunit TatA [Kitasatospora sp. GAS204B]|uniref:Sec-independent protein translocase subunit TatA n=1 Tax=unclassified Kitasatospora TaxID=2633591 RepID=UPI002474ACB0|nr:Sec-independent protein translocase subunit TatA [Kitasatospora sp. GAS204B]MDH6116987.1 sec-independent protein translocase protein TatA [Kitasatospora sp. GAS204B]
MFRNGLEPWHLLVVLAVVILLFGSKKLPEMARGLGKSMRILKAETKAMREDDAPVTDNTTASSTATEQERPAVAPVNVTKADETPKTNHTAA